MAKPLTVSIPHQLGVTEARRRLETGLAEMTSRLPGGAAKIEQRWEGDRLLFDAQISGQSITGALEVMADAVRMEIVLPGILGLLAGKIGGRLKDEGQKLLK
jgi:hypothetical protein